MSPIKSTILLFLVVGLSSILYGEEVDFRDGIETHQDWFERFDETHDYRIFYLLANRAGKVCDVAKAKEITEFLKNHPERREKLFVDWGIDVDTEAFNAKALEEWKERFGDEAIDIKTRQYHVFATKKDRKMATVLAIYMDHIFKFYQKKFKMDEKLFGRFMVKLHPNESSYRSTTRLGSSFAYFSAHKRCLVGYTKAFKKPSEEKDYAIRLIHTFFHEGFHQFISYYIPNPPTWLNEGMAEIFEAVIFRGKKLYENKNLSNYNLRWLRDYIKDKKLTPLKELIYMTQKELYDPNRINMHYAQCWGLIHFLAFGSSNNKKFYQDIIKELKNGADRLEAIDRVFAKVDWARFEKGYRQYLLRLKTTKGKSKL